MDSAVKGAGALPYDSGRTVIIACSSLTEYVEEAQHRCGTALPVIYMDRLYHRDPGEMRGHILAALAEKIPEGTDTVLVCMGFCGGSWEGVAAPVRMVLPRVDDCVSLLLQTGDTPVSDLKQPGHLYVRAKDPRTESFRRIFEHLTAAVDEETKARYHEDWKQLYSHIDILDTGINGSRRPGYAEAVQQDADWLNAQVEYVKGGTYLLEKLLRGDWDSQFLVLTPAEPVTEEQMLLRASAV